MKMLESKRNGSIDILRILMVFFVVVLHVLGFGVRLANLENLHWYAGHFIYRITIVAVNVLVLITGYVNFGKAFSFKNLLFLWLKVFLYSFGISLLFFVIKGNEVISLKSLILNCFPITTSQYWFFSCYFILMIIRPFLDIVILNAKRYKLAFGLFILLFVASVMGGLFFDPFILKSGYSPLWFCILYVCGAYFKKYSPKFNTKILLVLFVVCIILGVIFAKIADFYDAGGGYAYNFPINVASSFLLFALFVSNKRQRKNNIVAFINASVFDVYLISEHFIIKQLIITGKFEFLLNYNFLVMIGGVLLFSLAIYLGCLVIGIIVTSLLNLLKVKKLFAKLEIALKETLKKLLGKIKSRYQNEQNSDS